MDNDPAMAFSAQFKAKVSAAASLSGGMTLQSVQTARDGTHKLVFSLAEVEGGARGSVETVLIPMTNRSGTNLRYTACLSTQVGCAMNCQFCYTGRMGLQGNLSTAQIVEQVPRPVPISNIVFMGMGEPLDNFDCVMAAIDVLAQGLELARSKIIVSTVGLADRMVRNWIVPTNRRFPLQRLVTTLEQHFPAHAPSARGDNFVVLEYVLLGGVNDSLADAERLVALTANIYCMVNLIVFNPWDGTTFKKSTDQAVRAFRGVLMAAGRVCTLRVSKGDDEMAACGQLGDPGQGRKRVPIAEPPAAFRQLVAGAVAVSGA
ncbi:elp3 domain-containing protein, partial [Haematococcus lacustris]